MKQKQKQKKTTIADDINEEENEENEENEEIIDTQNKEGEEVENIEKEEEGTLEEIQAFNKIDSSTYTVMWIVKG